MSINLFKKNVINADPFVKWVGGKRQLLDKFSNRLPQELIKHRSIHRYIEPFVGGGAMFFFLKSYYSIKESYLFDINRELIIGYNVIKNSPKKLIDKLKEVEENYLSMDEEERNKFYYNMRDEYNLQMSNFNYNEYNESWIKRACYLIFLNRTCFNGLFRQNQKGEFNVPHGRYKNPTICDKENILKVHKALQDTKIFCADFENSKKYITENSFVYFDPPYRPLNGTSNFTGYFKEGFDEEDQVRLAKFFKEMDKRNAYLMLSNSDPKNENPDDNFFDDLYSKYKIERIPAKRSINSKGEKRGEINELLIRNYSL